MNDVSALQAMLINLAGRFQRELAVEETYIAGLINTNQVHRGHWTRAHGLREKLRKCRMLLEYLEVLENGNCND
ncbi:MAG: hypothetical protein GY945_10425 [Rhodobacteraceae bacterium]|nr:hypothetical protein [Paracoccaceae bacterium]